MTATLILIGIAALIFLVLKLNRKIDVERAERLAMEQKRSKAEREAQLAQEQLKRTSLSEWKHVLEVVETPNFFNPFKGGNGEQPVTGQHSYKAKMEGGELTVRDESGRSVKVKIGYDEISRTAAVFLESGEIIGGWQLAHTRLPSELLVALVNEGKLYKQVFDLPTTLPRLTGINNSRIIEWKIHILEKVTLGPYLETAMAGVLANMDSQADAKDLKFSKTVMQAHLDFA